MYCYSSVFTQQRITVNDTTCHYYPAKWCAHYSSTLVLHLNNTCINAHTTNHTNYTLRVHTGPNDYVQLRLGVKEIRSVAATQAHLLAKIYVSVLSRLFIRCSETCLGLKSFKHHLLQDEGELYERKFLTGGKNTPCSLKALKFKHLTVC